MCGIYREYLPTYIILECIIIIIIIKLGGGLGSELADCHVQAHPRRPI